MIAGKIFKIGNLVDLFISIFHPFNTQNDSIIQEKIRFNIKKIKVNYLL